MSSSTSAPPPASAAATTTTTTTPTGRLPPDVVELVTPPLKLAERRRQLAEYGPFGLKGVLLLALAAVPVWSVLVFETLARAWKKGSLYAALSPPRDPDALADKRAPWPFPVKEFSVPVEGGKFRLACVELADPDGGNSGEDKPLALFLSGFPELPYSWRHTMPVVAKKGYRCVALAQRGYYPSDLPDGVASYHLRRLADDVRDACDALTGTKVLLVAHDWGGSVAWAAAALHSVSQGGPIERMVVMALPPLALYGANLSAQQCLRSLYVLRFQLPWLPEATLFQDDSAAVGLVFSAPGIGCVTLEAEAEARDKAAAAEAAAGGGKGGRAAAIDASAPPPPPLRMSDADVAVYRHAFSQPGRAAAALNYYRALVRWTLAPALAPLGLLSAYRDDALFCALRRPLDAVPVLLLHGDADVALLTRLTDGWEAVCAHEGSRAFLLGRCSHWVPQDRPRAVGELLNQWLPAAAAK
jgi:epoxide hydrolase 4